MKKRKIPMRMCVGCRQMKPKKELVRIVKSPDGAIDVDLKGKAPGRGAYICYSQECLEKATKGKILDRALEQNISPEIYEYLKSNIIEGGQNK